MKTNKAKAEDYSATMLRWLSDGKVSMRVSYPSGSRFTIEGRLGINHNPSLPPWLMVERGYDHRGRDLGVYVLDPRGIVRDEAGSVLYHPRAVCPSLQEQWVIDWLAAHPEWAPAEELPI